MFKVEAISRFLKQRTHADLSALYHMGMECQVNVGVDGGVVVSDKHNGISWQGWTDGQQTWKHFRIPFNANSTPYYEDSQLNWDFEKHVLGIGLTGWNWEKRQSEWVAFDFDAIIGHTVGLTDAELQAVRDAASDLPYVTIRKSTSGAGLHLYVNLEPPVPTQNHTEHAALGRAILSMLSARCCYDFDSKVDICGGNMWIWHRKLDKTNGEGLRLVKLATESLTRLPDNWREHIDVVSGRRKRIKLFDSSVEDLANARAYVKFDDGHRRLLDWLDANHYFWEWDNDYKILKTHTYALKLAHGQLNCVGPFDTKSEGTEGPGDRNCFCFPIRDGGWIVRRYGKGIPEANGWTQDKEGWTRTYYNKPPDLEAACTTSKGVLDPKGWFEFKSARDAVIAMGLLKQTVTLPDGMMERKAKIKQLKETKVIFSVEANESDVMDGWILDKKSWVRIFNASIGSVAESEIANFDAFLRHLVTEDGTNCGWRVAKADNTWVNEPLKHASLALKAMNFGASEVDTILGTAITRCWTMVTRPFQPEYLGNRIWNYDAPQLRFEPYPEDVPTEYPHWQSLLDHLGTSLNWVVEGNDWCRENGIKTGADYLMAWIACIIQKPHKRLPYLFFFSVQQKTGKSTFAEALKLLVTKGVVHAKQALTSQQGFNAELENAVICSIEEIDLSSHKGAYNKIKDLTTAKTIQIHKKGIDPYDIPNMAHFIHTANSPKNCPIFPGDSRITMIEVAPLGPGKEIPSDIFLGMLEKEGRAFTTALLRMKMPDDESRMAIPVLESEAKIAAIEENKTSLHRFLDEKVQYCPGSLVRLTEFHLKFHEWMALNEIEDKDYWTKQKIQPPGEMPKGRWPKDANTYIANVSFDMSLKSAGPAYYLGPKGELLQGREHTKAVG